MHALSSSLRIRRLRGTGMNVMIYLLKQFFSLQYGKCEQHRKKYAEEKLKLENSIKGLH